VSLTDAVRRIDGIRDVLGQKALRLAYHAALPVVMDAELLNLLRVNFFLDPPDDLPYEVEASLLLSSLFREIGEGLYEIEPGLRNLLLSGLQRDYGEERVRRVAALLEQYTGASVAWRGWPELDAAQRLTAPASPLNSQNRPCDPGRTTSRACGNPDSRPGSRAIVIPRR